MRAMKGIGLMRRSAPVALLLCAWLLLGNVAGAQRDKKKKKDAAASDSARSPVPLPEEQQIELGISEMLGGWQIGDTERMHKHYADDVTVVSGAWEPPVVGWNNYLASYQRLRARMQEVRKDRQNTLVRVNGNFAWACFQWDFSAIVDGQPMNARGHTTLILEKRNGAWLIIHDHTSLVQMGPPAGPVASPAAAPPPTTPPGASPYA